MRRAPGNDHFDYRQTIRFNAFHGLERIGTPQVAHPDVVPLCLVTFCLQVHWAGSSVANVEVTQECALHLPPPHPVLVAVHRSRFFHS